MLVKFLLSSILIIGCMGQTAFAKTDDAGVLAGLESNSDMYSYLNHYHYSLWLADHRYSSHDNVHLCGPISYYFIMGL